LSIISSLPGGAEHPEGGPHRRLGREGERGEVGPDVAVLRAGQQQHLGVLDTTAGTADLLVVGDRGAGGAEVHHEPQVGLVEAHAQRGRGDQRLDPVGQQVVLGALPLGGVGLAGVGDDRVAPLAQVAGELLGGADGERVDDAGAGQLAEVLGQPAEPVRAGGQPQYPQAQRVAVQRAAQHQRVTAGHPELVGDVAGHPVVRGGRGGQHRDPGRQVGEQ
jgi:hypothetical protein